MCRKEPRAGRARVAAIFHTKFEEAKNSEFVPGLLDHYEGIFVRVIGQDVFYLTV